MKIGLFLILESAMLLVYWRLIDLQMINGALFTVKNLKMAENVIYAAI